VWLTSETGEGATTQIAMVGGEGMVDIGASFYPPPASGRALRHPEYGNRPIAVSPRTALR
jgi:hypothetical protein